MAGGIWEAIGAALQSGSNTYRDATAQQQAQRQAEERLRLQQEEQERIRQWQAAQLKLQQDAAAQSAEDRQIGMLKDAIEGATPDTDLTQFVPDIRARAPHLLSRLNVQPQSAGLNVTSGLGPTGNPLTLDTPGAGASFSPEKATRRASLAEQHAQGQIEGQQVNLAQAKANQAMAEKIMQQLGSGQLKDTPRNRALLAQYTSVSPNEVWGSIEHPSRASTGSGRGTAPGGIVAAVLANPSLYEQLTPSVRTAISPALHEAGFDFTRAMNPTGIKYMAEADAALSGARDLQKALEDDAGESTGAIQGLAGYLPDMDIFQTIFSTRDVKLMQSKIDLVRQRIGKLLEGGVLRKEDEVKYAKILPTVLDSVDVQKQKMQNVLQTLENDIAAYAGQQDIAGRRVQLPRPPGQATAAPAPSNTITIGRFQVEVGK